MLSLAIPVAAGLLQWSLWTTLSPLTWILFYPAVFLSAYLGGLLCGLIATAIALLIGIYFFIPPEGSLAFTDARYYYSTGIFVLMGLSFNLAFEQLRRSKAELQRIANLESDIHHRRLTQALRAANAGIWEWNLQTNQNQWDEGLWRLYGLEPFSCQASYDLWLSTVHPDDSAMAQAAIRQAVQQNIELYLEWRLAALCNGQERWLMSRGQPELDEQGRPRLYRGIVIDISQRKRIENLIHEQEQRLGFALETLNAGAWELNLDTLVAHRTLLHDQIFGYDTLQPDWTYEMFLEHVVPEHRQMVDQSFRAAREGQTDWSFDCRIRRADGVIRWICAQGRPKLDQTGKAVLLSGIVQDITARKNTEQALQQQERLLADSQAVAHIGSWMVDLVSGQIVWSEETYRLHGLSPETDVPPGREQFLQLFHQDDRPALQAWIELMLSGDQAAGLEFRTRPVNGESRWLSAIARVERGAGGEPLRIIGTVQDITEKKQMAAEKQRWADAFRYCAHGIAIVCADARSIVSCNPAFVRLLGYKDSKAIEGRSILSLHDAERVGLVMQCLQEADTLGQASFESVYRREDGSKFTGSVDLVSVKDQDDKVIYRVATIQDISLRKRQEAELFEYRDHLQNLVEERTRELTLARQHAEHLSQVKSSFVANMSHEIRTPMNAVLGFCYLLEQHPLDEDERGLVRKIRDAGRSLLAIINDILDFSKIEAGRLEIENVPFRLSDMFDHLAALMATSADSKNLELIIIPPEDVDAVIGDGLRIQQVLVNLLSNAVKFTERGEVALRVSVHAAQNGDKVALRFAVRDTGIGISEQQLDDVFAAFSQADNTISRRFGGSGLGLTISRQLVGLMGGELQVSSVVGEGSEFWFVLRLQRHLDHTQAVLPLHNLKLLVVDDCENTREAVHMSARSLNWDTTPVASGRAAIVEVLASLENAAPYDVLLLDWQMPGVDGMSVAESIRVSLSGDKSDPPRTPIILMVTSSYSRQLLASHADMSHVDGVLSKPITPSSLYNAVVAVLSKSSKPLLAAPDKSSISAGQRIQGVRILVVDDSDINREVASRILESEGAQVSLASDGQDAVDWLLGHPNAVDLVLMDVQMPRMDGYAATRRIRENPDWADLPIVALTAGAFKNLQDAALEAGMNDFIAKPFNVPQMLALIARWTVRKSPSGVAIAASDDTLGRAMPSGQTDSLFITPNSGQDAWPGIDLNAGLTIWNQNDLYQTYLARFVDQYRYAGREIGVAAAEGNLAAIAALAHKLKGAAYGLALADVAKRSVDVETALSSGESLAAASAALQQALEVVVVSIGNYLAATASPTSGGNGMESDPDPHQ
ncbi:MULTISPECIES: PAS domain-containing protein [Methylomonas]|uniref:histidine kinase n=2 Tax=Methylomonas TaxID=416 RepID=A0A140E3P6_9GAMM|nr:MULTISPECIES: PAS domain-containing protein [Methylomonas]AMK75020.1 hypothetical protein JT25_000725 [Methylomonas denitrificans]OAI02516.1 hypothetical protein A1342_01715 [Methylomonas methanica]TCV83166.1 PAS domain S-box-containing protein [Methylomonas methanica]